MLLAGAVKFRRNYLTILMGCDLSPARSTCPLQITQTFFSNGFGTVRKIKNFHRNIPVILDVPQGIEDRHKIHFAPAECQGFVIPHGNASDTSHVCG